MSERLFYFYKFIFDIVAIFIEHPDHLTYKQTKNDTIKIISTRMPDFLKLNFEFEHVNYLFTLTTHDL